MCQNNKKKWGAFILKRLKSRKIIEGRAIQENRKKQMIKKKNSKKYKK